MIQQETQLNNEEEGRPETQKCSRQARRVVRNSTNLGNTNQESSNQIPDNIQQIFQFSFEKQPQQQQQPLQEPDQHFYQRQESDSFQQGITLDQYFKKPHNTISTATTSTNTTSNNNSNILVYGQQKLRVNNHTINDESLGFEQNKKESVGFITNTSRNSQIDEHEYLDYLQDAFEIHETDEEYSESNCDSKADLEHHKQNKQIQQPLQQQKLELDNDNMDTQVGSRQTRSRKLSSRKRKQENEYLQISQPTTAYHQGVDLELRDNNIKISKKIREKYQKKRYQNFNSSAISWHNIHQNKTDKEEDIVISLQKQPQEINQTQQGGPTQIIQQSSIFQQVSKDNKVTQATQQQQQTNQLQSQQQQAKQQNQKNQMNGSSQNFYNNNNNNNNKNNNNNQTKTKQNSNNSYKQQQQQTQQQLLQQNLNLQKNNLAISKTFYNRKGNNSQSPPHQNQIQPLLNHQRNLSKEIQNSNSQSSIALEKQKQQQQKLKQQQQQLQQQQVQQQVQQQQQKQKTQPGNKVQVNQPDTEKNIQNHIAFRSSFYGNNVTNNNNSVYSTSNNNNNNNNTNNVQVAQQNQLANIQINNNNGNFSKNRVTMNDFYQKQTQFEDDDQKKLANQNNQAVIGADIYMENIMRRTAKENKFLNQKYKINEMIMREESTITKYANRFNLNKEEYEILINNSHSFKQNNNSVYNNNYHQFNSNSQKKKRLNTPNKKFRAEFRKGINNEMSSDAKKSQINQQQNQLQSQLSQNQQQDNNNQKAKKPQNN